MKTIIYEGKPYRILHGCPDTIENLALEPITWFQYFTQESIIILVFILALMLFFCISFFYGSISEFRTTVQSIKDYSDYCFKETNSSLVEIKISSFSSWNKNESTYGLTCSRFKELYPVPP